MLLFLDAPDKEQSMLSMEGEETLLEQVGLAFLIFPPSKKKRTKNVKIVQKLQKWPKNVQKMGKNCASKLASRS